MDEELINKLIKYKLNAVGKIVDRMPEKMSAEIKDFGRVILESVNENVREMKEQPSKETKPSDKLNHVPIE
jgi:hypothetical protein